MNPETSFICITCQKTYTMSEKEFARFKELAATVENFQMPRRCFECRRARRLQPQPFVHPGNMQTPKALEAEIVNESEDVSSTVVTQTARAEVRVALETPAASACTPAPSPSVPKPIEEKKEEVLFVLATKDFDELVHGQAVVWRGVRVVLADIGFAVMRRAIDDAELEKAKKHIKANGH